MQVSRIVIFDATAVDDGGLVEIAVSGEVTVYPVDAKIDWFGFFGDGSLQIALSHRPAQISVDGNGNVWVESEMPFVNRNIRRLWPEEVA